MFDSFWQFVLTILVIFITFYKAYWIIYHQEFRLCRHGLFKPGIGLSSYFIVCLLAFNVNKQSPRSEMTDLFDKQFCCARTPDVFAITLTELKYWRNAYRDDMKGFFGTNGFEQLAYTRQMRTSLEVYVRRDNLSNFSDVKHQSMRLDSILKLTLVHKAACNVTFRYNGVSFSFVGTHLSAHDEGNEKRIAEYGEIVRRFKLDHDYQFWMGDLNFRLEGLSYAEVEDLIAEEDWTTLMEYDQLRMAQQNENAFTSFQEGPINFAPTFKFNIGSDTYSRKRTPAYTDRILYNNMRMYQNLSKSMESLVDVDVAEYQALHDVNTSDHKPVRALAMIPNEAFLVKNGMIDEYLSMLTVLRYSNAIVQECLVIQEQFNFFKTQ